jgi:serine/threonine protein kinase
MINPGTRLQERYDILQFIGQGGMAAVYLGADTRLGNRYVAIKQMDPTKLPHAEQQPAVRAFQQEAQVLAQLNHPAIARVIDFFQEDRFWYLVMEYVEGEGLDSALNRFPRGFEEQQVLLWAAQLGSALDYLHQQNPPIIFRDLKPANVMVQPDGVLKLIDFGIARYFKPGQNQDTIRFGTPGYAAPEQYGRGQTDARSDIFSLGVLLHQLLTGYDPALSPMNLPAIRSMRPDISYRTVQTIEQAIRVDPGQRFVSIQQFAAALGISISGALPAITGPTTSLSTTALSNWLARQRPAVLAGMGAVIVMVLLFIGVYAVGRNSDDPVTASATPSSGFVIVEVTQVVTPTPSSLVTEPIAPTSEIPAKIETPTETPTVTPSSTATPQPSPTPTSSPSPTFTATAVSVVCSFSAASAFSNTYQSYSTQLGCPTSNAWTTWSAIGQFQRGRMFWRQDNGRIYVIYNNGGWASFADTWSEGRDPEYSCGSPQQTPPTPKRGFGKVWCTQTGVQQAIGNATGNEWGEESSLQAFSNGLIWQNSTGRYILFNNGSWRHP